MLKPNFSIGFMKDISIETVTFLSPQWNLVRDIRFQVFVVEQNVSEDEEYDEFEAVCNHFLATVNNEPAGTARWRKTENGFKLERFAVLAKFRSKGVGKALVEKVLSEVLPLSAHQQKIYLHAQVQALPFYQKLGFLPYGETFIEAEIVHKAMYFPH